MLKIGTTALRTCQGISRREILHVGGLGLAGLTLSNWFRSSAAAPGAYANHGPDTSCIFIFLSGAPSQFETFDPKPKAPVKVRGPYGLIATNVSGIHISELLPMTAQHMDKCAIIRSANTKGIDHAGTAMLSGESRAQASYGAVLAKLKGATRTGMPPFVHVGPNSPGFVTPTFLPGSGTLGAVYGPVVIPDPTGKQVKFPEFGLTADVSGSRFKDR